MSTSGIGPTDHYESLSEIWTKVEETIWKLVSEEFLMMAKDSELLQQRTVLASQFRRPPSVDVSSHSETSSELLQQTLGDA